MGIVLGKVAMLRFAQIQDKDYRHLFWNLLEHEGKKSSIRNYRWRWCKLWQLDKENKRGDVTHLEKY